MICTSMHNIFQSYQTVLPMKIVMAHQTHANLTFVIVDRPKNAPEESIHVQKGIANAARMIDVCTRKLVGLENAEVSNFKCSKTCIIYYMFN